MRKLCTIVTVRVYLHISASLQRSRVAVMADVNKHPDCGRESGEGFCEPGRRYNRAVAMRRETDDNFQLEDGTVTRNVSVLFQEVNMMRVDIFNYCCVCFQRGYR